MTLFRIFERQAAAQTRSVSAGSRELARTVLVPRRIDSTLRAPRFAPQRRTKLRDESQEKTAPAEAVFPFCLFSMPSWGRFPSVLSGFTRLHPEDASRDEAATERAETDRQAELSRSVGLRTASSEFVRSRTGAGGFAGRLGTSPHNLSRMSKPVRQEAAPPSSEEEPKSIPDAIEKSYDGAFRLSVFGRLGAPSAALGRRAFPFAITSL